MTSAANILASNHILTWSKKPIVMQPFPRVLIFISIFSNCCSSWVIHNTRAAEISSPISRPCTNVLSILFNCSINDTLKLKYHWRAEYKTIVTEAKTFFSVSKVKAYIKKQFGEKATAQQNQALCAEASSSTDLHHSGLDHVWPWSSVPTMQCSSELQGTHHWFRLYIPIGS